MSFDRKIRRILVIKNRAIGDTILLTGVLRVLKHHRPNHQIHVLVRSPAGELLEGLPYIDRVISAVEPPEKIERLAYWMRLVRRLREKKYELVLNFHASFRTALTAKFLRAAECIANHHELSGRNWFSDRKVPSRGFVKSIIDRDLDVLRAIGIEAEIQAAMPEIILSPTELREAVQRFESKSTPFRGPRVFLGVGGSRETKRWPPDHFAVTMCRLATEFDASFVLSTVASDRPWCETLWPLIQREPALEGRVSHFLAASLRHTAQTISQCELYLGNDSGLKHLAVALGLKTFTVFGPEAPFEWHPYDRARHPYAFIDNLVCRTESGKHWCPAPICRAQDHHQCMRGITPDRVWAELERLIGPAPSGKAPGVFL